ncbi:Glutathione-binding protein GsiB [Saezia sanguinis]|uniref:Glutathione-binding protein GsiB n=1 Tax=Saezia sanguinis TaxID=1965230 RepID=A0A433SDS4_9BURK|nr:Glutathione-binding protein GsiB [Saezia sanguinis]
MTHRFGFFRLLAVFLMVVVMACAMQARAQTRVVLAVGGQPETLDPYNTNTTMTMAVTKSFYEGLYQFDRNFEIKPVLALRYTVSDDGLVYTFELRSGVKFHDGTVFDANAVKVNFDRAKDPANALVRYNQFNRIERVEVVDPLTVRFVLKEPFGPFINTIAHPSAAIISPKALQQYGKDIAFHPVGTGPYTFAEWRQTDFIKGTRFEGYWRTGYPKVDEVIWMPVMENNTRAAMLQTGEADFAFPVPYEQVDGLKSNRSLQVITTPSIMMRYLSFNMLHKPFDDIRVRQAINYAINREALAKVAFNGYAFPAQGFVPQGVAYAHKMAPWPYDPAKARALLAEAGYPNGFESVLWGGINNTTTQKVLQFLQQQLGQVGIKVSILGLESGQRAGWVEGAPDPQTAGVRLYYIGWSTSTGEADWALRPLLSTQAWPPGLNNTAYYSSAQFDAYLEQALKATGDEDKRTIYQKAQELLAVDLPWAPLVTDEIVYAHNKRVTGIYVLPDSNIDINELAVSE